MRNPRRPKQHRDHPHVSRRLDSSKAYRGLRRSAQRMRAAGFTIAVEIDGKAVQL